ncbi:MAG: hypothetical protein VCA40_01685, partial [Roseibacillus sp.]
MRQTIRIIAIHIAAICLAPWCTAGAQSFYKEPHGLFSTRPGETKSLQNIKRFGPVGPAPPPPHPPTVMRISDIEDPPPAAVTGKL